MGKRIISSAVLVMFMFSLTGCSTIMCKGEQSINIKTAPPAAEIKVYNSKEEMVFTSTTPTIAVLKRGKGYFSAEKYRIVITKEGYQARELCISGRVNSWYLFGNLLFGGIVGYLIVDPISGAMWTLSPSDITLELQSELSALGPKEAGLTIVLKEKVPEELTPYLKPVAKNEQAIEEVTKEDTKEISKEEKETSVVAINSESKIQSFAEYYRLVYKTVTESIVKPENAEGGTVNVAIILTSDGALQEVNILDGSAEDPLLRNAVLEAVKKSAPFPRFPDDIKNETQKSFTVSIDFRRLPSQQESSPPA